MEEKNGLKLEPYVGYWPGKTIIVAGVRTKDAQDAVTKAFIEEYREFLPDSIIQSAVALVVGARKLDTDIWATPIEEVLDALNRMYPKEERKFILERDIGKITEGVKEDERRMSDANRKRGNASSKR